MGQGPDVAPVLQDEVQPFRQVQDARTQETQVSGSKASATRAEVEHPGPVA